MSTSLQTQQKIHIRDSATVIPCPIPEQYEFLKAPVSRRKYRINFRHPAYEPDDNLLFTLYAWDCAEGGIHHGLAHSACSIFADNRIDGYLSRICDGEHGEQIQAAWDEVLPAAVLDYYFYVPYPPNSPLPLTGQSRPPFRWPVVTSFQDWKFGQLPESWARFSNTQGTMSNTAPQSNLTAAIRQRDITCRITAFESGTEVAHLIPEHERQWFLLNSMAAWNTDLTLDPDNLLRDLSNAVLLRSDMHLAFDQRKFVFFPKDPDGFVLHMLEPTSDIGKLYHNTRVNIPHCSLEFLFARFAWSMFPSLSGFLSRPARSRLVVRINANGERIVEEVTNPFILGRKVTASRSNSPTKRSRIAANLDEGIEYSSKRSRVCQAKSDESSFAFALSTLVDDSEFEQRPSHTFNNSQATTPCKVSRASDLYRSKNAKIAASTFGCTDQFMDLELGVIKHSDSPNQGYIDKLRQEALAQQRPKGYAQERLPYDRQRPAKEELELMGIEILEDPDEILEDV